MPEGLEAEIWRSAVESLVGRVISDVWFDTRVAPADLADVLTSRRVEQVRRIGKVLILDTDGRSLGLHFGMTGRLVIDGSAPIERLEYSSAADRAEWDRLRLSMDGARTVALRMNDPRRLGRLSIDPDLDHLGPEALTLTTGELAEALASRSAPIKPLLLDQGVVAGLGNLCADEVLFHAGIRPSRSAKDLDDSDVDRLAVACRDSLAIMLERGGSTTGVIDPTVRAALPPCPLDGGALRRDSIGGRTAVWCSRHQH